MRYIIALFLTSALLTGCSIYHEKGTTRVSVGKDTGLEMLKQTHKDGSETIHLTMDSNESRSFQQLAKAIRAAIYIDGVKSVSGDIANYFTDRDQIDGQVKSIQTTTEAATRQAAIEAATEQAALQATP